MAKNDNKNIVKALKGIANSNASVCMQLEACRNLKSQLLDEIRTRDPFRETKRSDIALKEVKKHAKAVKLLKSLCKEEKRLRGKLN